MLANSVPNFVDDVPWGYLTATIPAIVGVIGAFWYNQRLARIKTAIELHAEFHEQSFIASRIAADAVLKTHLGSNPATIDSIYAATKDDEKTWPHVSRVLHFFERLSVLRKKRLVNRKTCDALFRGYIAYYKQNYFDRLSAEHPDWQPLVRALKRLPT